MLAEMLTARSCRSAEMKFQRRVKADLRVGRPLVEEDDMNQNSAPD